MTSDRAVRPARRGHRLIVVAAVVAVLPACAARAPARPTGQGVADPRARAVFLTATAPCGGVRTLTAALRLSGRAGGRISGTLHAGLAAPASVRFEAVAPFGQPFFILAGADNRVTLVLPRDKHVLADAPLGEVLERLLGVNLDAVELRRLLTGCPPADASPAEGRSFGGGWLAVQSGADITTYVRTVNGRPVVVAMDDARWQIDYADHLNGWPRRVRIRRRADTQVDLTAVIEQLEINVELAAAAFTVVVPPDATPITLDDVLHVAPLRPPD